MAHLELPDTGDTAIFFPALGAVADVAAVGFADQVTAAAGNEGTVSSSHRHEVMTRHDCEGSHEIYYHSQICNGPITQFINRYLVHFIFPEAA